MTADDLKLKGTSYNFSESKVILIVNLDTQQNDLKIAVSPLLPCKMRHSPRLS